MLVPQQWGHHGRNVNDRGGYQLAQELDLVFDELDRGSPRVSNLQDRSGVHGGHDGHQNGDGDEEEALHDEKWGVVGW